MARGHLWSMRQNFPSPVGVCVGEHVCHMRHISPCKCMAFLLPPPAPEWSPGERREGLKSQPRGNPRLGAGIGYQTSRPTCNPVTRESRAGSRRTQGGSRSTASRRRRWDPRPRAAGSTPGPSVALISRVRRPLPWAPSSAGATVANCPHKSHATRSPSEP